MTGDGAKRSLIAPLWSADKKRVLNAINCRFLSDNLEQGSAFLTGCFFDSEYFSQLQNGK